MADTPTRRRRRPVSTLGPPLLGVAAALFVLTRIIVWLPLGFVGTFINGIIWPFIVLSLLGGAFLTWRRMSR